MGTLDNSDKALIVGAGPAGISAALWLAELKVPFEWYDRARSLGGQLQTVYNPIVNFAGSRAESGAGLIETFATQLRAEKIAPRFGVEVFRAEECSDRVWVETSEGQANFGALIVATGTERRALRLPGVEEALGKGLALSGRKEARRFEGRPVAVIGGGDAAVENALLLADYATHVTLIHRSQHFRARPEFLDAARAHPRIEIKTDTELVQVFPGDGDFLAGIEVQKGDELCRLDVEGLLIRIGVAGAGPKVHIHGHLVCADRYYRGAPLAARIVFAGDCVCPTFRAVAVAVGQGATAARHVCTVLGHG